MSNPEMKTEPEPTDFELAAMAVRHEARQLRESRPWMYSEPGRGVLQVGRPEPEHERAARLATAASLDLVADWLQREAARRATP